MNRYYSSTVTYTPTVVVSSPLTLSPCRNCRGTGGWERESTLGKYWDSCSACGGKGQVDGIRLA